MRLPKVLLTTVGVFLLITPAMPIAANGQPTKPPGGEINVRADPIHPDCHDHHEP